MNPWVLPARPAVGAQFGAEVTGMVLGWWRWPKGSCTPSAPSLKLHPWGCLAMIPLVMWGLETAFFLGRNEGGDGWCFLPEQAQSEGHRFALLQPPAPWTPGQGPPCCGVSRIWDSWWDACSQLRGLACVDVAEQSSREGRSWERSVGTLGSSSLRHLRSLRRGSSRGASCSPVPACQREKKMTLKHYFKLRWDVVAWCSFPPLRRVVHTPWGRSHAAQRSVGWTCLAAA